MENNLLTDLEQLDSVFISNLDCTMTSRLPNIAAEAIEYAIKFKNSFEEMKEAREKEKACLILCFPHSPRALRARGL